MRVSVRYGHGTDTPLTRERSTSASAGAFFVGVHTSESDVALRDHGRWRTRDRAAWPARAPSARARDMLRRRDCWRPAPCVVRAGRLRLRPARAGWDPRMVALRSMCWCMLRWLSDAGVQRAGQVTCCGVTPGINGRRSSIKMLCVKYMG